MRDHTSGGVVVSCMRKLQELLNRFSRRGRRARRRYRHGESRLTAHWNIDNTTAFALHMLEPRMLLSGLQTIDIGNPPAPTSYTQNSAYVLSVAAAGSGFLANADQGGLLAVNAALPTPVTVTADVAPPAQSYPAAQVGAMVRDNASAGASFAAVLVNSAGAVTFETRAADGAAVVDQVATPTPGSSFYVKLVETQAIGQPGQASFTGSFSTDGVNYTAIDPTPVTVAFSSASNLAGLAVASGGSSVITANFTAAAVAPTGFSGADIGAPGVAGGTAYDAVTNTWALVGAGSDIYNTSDQFQFASQTFTGDGGITANINSMTNTNAFAKTGIMLRDTNAADSAFVDLVYTNTLGLQLIYRPTAGAAAQQSGVNVPVTGTPYLRLWRQGNVYSAYYSMDGVNWRQIGSQITVAFSSTSNLAGLVECSHNNAAADVGTFSNVSVTNAPFMNQDIGNPGVAGSGNYNSATGVWTVSGSGSDIFNSGDQFTMVGQSLIGDGTVIARVDNMQNADAYAKTGVMIRDGNGANAAFVDLVYTNTLGLQFLYRATAGANAQQNGVSTPISGPFYLKLVKAGVDFSAYYSTDGTNYTQIGTTQSVTFVNPVGLAGIVVCSHNNSDVNTSTFDNVSVTPASALPAGYSDANIGVPPYYGAASYDSTTGVWTVSGSGSDIWNAQDQLNFVSTPISGDGQIQGEVTSQTYTDPWAKAGLMFRQSADAASAFVDLVLTPGNGVAMNWRTSSGGALGGTNSAILSGPIYLRLARSGNTFTGYVSTDNQTWTAIDSVTVNMTDPVMAGLAATSHNTGASIAATFANVSVGALTTTASVPLPPTIMFQDAISPTDIYLGWLNNDTPSEPAFSYILESSIDGGATYSQLATLPAGQNTAWIKNLTPGTTYNLRVITVDANTGQSMPGVYGIVTINANTMPGGSGSGPALLAAQGTSSPTNAPTGATTTPTGNESGFYLVTVGSPSPGDGGLLPNTQNLTPQPGKGKWVYATSAWAALLSQLQGTIQDGNWPTITVTPPVGPTGNPNITSGTYSSLYYHIVQQQPGNNPSTFTMKLEVDPNKPDSDGESVADNDYDDGYIALSVAEIDSIQGQANIAYQNSSQDFTLGSFEVVNPATAPGSFEAIINWGDGSATTLANLTSSGSSSSGSEYTIDATHTYSRPGPFVPVAEILTQGSATYQPATIMGGYVEVRRDANPAKHQGDVSHNISLTSSAQFTESPSFDTTAGTYSVSMTDSSIAYNYSEELNQFNEPASPGYTYSETAATLSFSASATGSFQTAPSSVTTDALTLGGYSLSAQNNSPTTIAQQQQDIHDTYNTALAGSVTYNENKNYTNTSSAVQSGSYTWNFNESSIAFSVTQTGVTHMAPTVPAADDPLASQDANVLAMKLANAGLFGSFSASGNETYNYSISETGDYSSNAWTQNDQGSSSSSLTQKSNDGSENYTQSVSTNDSSSVTITGNQDSYTVYSADSSSPSINRTVNDGQSTSTATGSIAVSATMHKTGDFTTGEYTMSMSTTEKTPSMATTSNDGAQHGNGSSNVTNTYTDSASGNEVSGDFSISAGLSGSMGQTTTVSDSSASTTTTYSASPTQSLSESGNYYGSTESLNVSDTPSATTTQTQIDQQQSATTTTTDSGSSSIVHNENLSTADYTTTVTDTGKSTTTVSANNQTENTTGSTIASANNTVSTSGNDITGSYTTNGNDTTGTTDYSTVTNQSGTTTSTVYSTSTNAPVLSTTSSGNDITGDYSISTTNTGTSSSTTTAIDQSQYTTTTEYDVLNTTANNQGNSVTGTYSQTDTSSPGSTTVFVHTSNGNLTSDSTANVTPNSTTHSSGNTITGDYSISTTDIGSSNTTSSSHDQNQNTTGSLSVTDNSTVSTTGNHLTGSYSSNANDTTGSTNYSTVFSAATNQNGTTTSTVYSTSTNAPVLSTTSSGNDITGDYSISTTNTGTSSSTTTSIDQSQYTTTTEYDVLNTTANSQGNNISGTYSQTDANSPGSTTVFVHTSNGNLTSDSTANVTPNSTTHSSGNTITGDYSISTTDIGSSNTTSSSHDQNQNTTGSSSVTDNSTVSTTGTHITGSYSSHANDTTGTSNHSTVFSTATNQNGTTTSTVYSTSTNAPVLSTTSSGNDITGDYSISTTNTGTSSSTTTAIDQSQYTTTTEYDVLNTTANSQGNNISGNYSDTNISSPGTVTVITHATNTSLVTSDSTTGMRPTSTTITTGNSITGDYHSSVTDTGTSTDNGSAEHTAAATSTSTSPAPTPVVQTTSDSATITDNAYTSSTGNDVTGSYSYQVIDQTDSTTTNTVVNQSDSTTATVYSNPDNTTINTGNNFTGDYTTVQIAGGTSVVNSKEVNQSQTVTSQDTTNPAGSTTTDTGNNFTGDYTVNAFQGGAVTIVSTLTDQTRTVYTQENDYPGLNSQTTGNNFTGSYSTTSSDTGSSTVYSQAQNQGLFVNSTTRNLGPVSTNSSGNTITGAVTTTAVDSGASTVASTTTDNGEVIVSNNTTYRANTTTTTSNDITGAYLTIENDVGSFFGNSKTTNVSLTITANSSGGSNGLTTTNGNSISGTYAVSNGFSTNNSTVFSTSTDQTDTIVSTQTDTGTQTIDLSAGNNISGAYSTGEHGTSTSSLVSLETNGNLAISSNSNATGTTTTGSTGNNITSDYTTGGTATNFSNNNSLTTNTNLVITQSGSSTSFSANTKTGNDIVGGYVSTTNDGGSSSGSEFGIAGTRSFTIVDTASNGGSVQENGNSVTGDVTGQQNSTNSSVVDKTDTYGASGGSDTQTLATTDGNTSGTTTNALTGSYTTSSTDIVNGTVSEHGTRGIAYSLTNTTNSTVGVADTGNSINGSYVENSSSSDSATLTRTATDTNGEAYTLTQTTTSSGNTSTGGNDIAGGYSSTAVGSQTVVTTETLSGSLDTVHSNVTATSTATDSQTGNSIYGNFSDVATQTNASSMVQTGSLNGSNFAVTETTNDSPTVTTTGNSIDGQASIVTTGSEHYTFNQSDISTAGNYSLVETGDKVYSSSATQNANDGSVSSVETGNDAYSMTETGALQTNQYTEVLTGNDNYTLTNTGNQQDGTYTQALTGTDTYTRAQNGTDNGVPYSTTVTAAGSFGQTLTGDAADGQISLVQTGTDRYAELEQFANPSDAANAGIGAVAFSAVGAPEMLSTPVTDPTGSLQSVGDINQKYCFAAGTMVVCCEGAALGEGALLSEGALLGEGAALGEGASLSDVWGPAILAAIESGASRTASGALATAEAIASAVVTRLVPIEKIQPGDYVLAVPENEPTAEPRPCRVLHAFRNPPNIIWEIRIDAGIIDSTDVVKTTAGHPFFVKSKARAARWTQAQDIQVGDRLRTPNGRWVIVDNVLCTKHKQEVFNLEVEDAHTYFVALPNSGKAVWVHNNSIDAPNYQPAPQAPSPAPTGSAPFIVNSGGSDRGSGTFNVGLGALAGRMQSGPAPSLAPPFSQESPPLSSPGRFSEDPLFDDRLFGGPLFPTEYVPLSPIKIDTSLNDLIPLKQQEAVEAPTILEMLGGLLGLLGEAAPPIAAGAVVFHASAAGGNGDMVPASYDPNESEPAQPPPAEPQNDSALIPPQDGGLPNVNKAVNSGIAHAADRAVERGLFSDRKSALEALRALSKAITRDGLPADAVTDPKRADSVLVPLGNGSVVYEINKNGTAVLRTVLGK